MSLEEQKLALEVRKIKQEMLLSWLRLAIGVGTLAIAGIKLDDELELSREMEAAQQTLHNVDANDDVEQATLAYEKIAQNEELPEVLRTKARALSTKIDEARDQIGDEAIECSGYAFYNPTTAGALVLPSEERKQLSRRCQAERAQYLRRDQVRISPRGTHWWWTMEDGTECACPREPSASR